MRSLALALAVAAVAALAAPAAVAQEPAPAPAPDPLLPTPGVCPGSNDVEAHYGLQRRSMHCLINHVRKEAGRRHLRSSAPLRHSATYKARRIAACKRFTHSPCGDELAAPFHQADVLKGRPWFVGENLGWKKVDEATAFALLNAWLGSRSHRRVLLDRRFTHLGVRRRRLRLDDLPHGIVIWVAHLGTPKRKRA